MSPARLAGVLVSVGVVLALGGAFLAGNLLGDVEPTAAATRPEDPAPSTSGGMATSETLDPTAVYWVRIHPGGPVQRVTLPPEEFPEVYELKALSASLQGELARRRGSVADR